MIRVYICVCVYIYICTYSSSLTYVEGEFIMTLMIYIGTNKYTYIYVCINFHALSPFMFMMGKAVRANMESQGYDMDNTTVVHTSMFT